MTNENNKIEGMPPLEDIMNETNHNKNNKTSKQNISLDGLPPLDSILDAAGYNKNDSEEIVEEEPKTYTEEKTKKSTSNKNDNKILIYVIAAGILAGALFCGMKDCSRRIKSQDLKFNYQNQPVEQREDVRKMYEKPSNYRTWQDRKDDYEKRRKSNKRRLIH